MSMTADTAFVSSVRSPRLMGSVFALFGHFAAAQRAARLYAELDALSDAALAARGLTRSEIPRVVARELDRV